MTTFICVDTREIILIPAVVSLIVASIALPIVLFSLRRMDVLDVPSERSLHSSAVPRGGGIALAIGYASGLLTLGSLIWPIWLATIGFALLGTWDDVKSRSPLLRLGLQIMVAGATCIGLIFLLDKPLWIFPLLFIVLISTVNAVNFMDGINGITALHAVVWGVSYVILFWFLDQHSYISLGIILCAIGLAFLPWNFPSAKLFLGDSGSYLIGGSLGLLAILGILANAPLAALSPLAIYAADTGVAVSRRIRSGERLTEPHKSHVFQQLVDSGWSHSRSALTTVGFTFITASLGILSINQPAILQLLLLVLILATCAIYLSLPRVVQRRMTNEAEVE